MSIKKRVHKNVPTVLALLMLWSAFLGSVLANVHPDSADQESRKTAFQDTGYDASNPGKTNINQAPESMGSPKYFGTNAAKGAVSGIWLDLGFGSGADKVVNAIVESDGDIFVGGFFTSAGGTVANNIARWDGASWHSLGVGSENGVNSTVRALAVVGSNLYVGGSFTAAGGRSANYIARWDGNAWSSVGTGMSSTVTALVAQGNNIYAGGIFRSAGGLPANGVAKWNGAQWSSLGNDATNGVEGSATALGVLGNDLFVAGNFTMAGGLRANNIARWNGESWFSLGSGAGNGVAFGNITTLAVASPYVYIGGTFTSAGGIGASRVARWNGSFWSPLGTQTSNGVDGFVNAIFVEGSKVYVGGDLSRANNPSGAVTVNNVALWDGAEWSTLVDGDPANPGVSRFVYALASVDNSVYVGGIITRAGSAVANGIARFSSSPGSTTPAKAFNGSLSGSWFDPARPGEGVLVEFGATGARRTAIFSWYTWSESNDGKQAWLFGSADYAAGATEVAITVYSGSGGRFGAFFNPANVQLSPWGQVSVNFPSCDTMNFTWRKLDGTEGLASYKRITLQLDGMPCS